MAKRTIPKKKSKRIPRSTRHQIDWHEILSKQTKTALVDELVELIEGDDRLARLEDLEIHDRVHLHGDIVPRDHVLWRDIHGNRPQAHLDHFIDERNKDDETGPFGLDDPAEAEDHTSLIFPKHLDG